MFKIFSTFLLVFGLIQFGYSQDTIVGNSKSISTPRLLERDTIRIIDTLATLSQDADLPTTFIRSTEKDSIVYVLKDDLFAARIDSLWMEELTNMQLFDSITDMVTNLDYDEILDVDLPTDTLKKRLKELDARTPFAVEYNTSLESVIKYFLKRKKGTMERLMALSEFYFPSFEEALDKHDLPLELKYLAVVESGLRPKAKSRVGATGIWQFMIGTGKEYGLEVNSYVDERMDPLKATDAACVYLKKLNKIFDDWDLALAAYNSGPGNVSKAIRRSGGNRNFWKIRKQLPRETAGYVPSFLATMYLFEYAEEHGYKPQKPPFHYFQTDTIMVKEAIGLNQIAAYTGVSLKEIQFLNPSYKLDIIPFNEKEPHYLRLPSYAVGGFVSNEESIYYTAKVDQERDDETLPELLKQPEQVIYKVKNGDYLGKIASRHGVNISEIKRWNNLYSNSLSIGQRLVLYPRDSQKTKAKIQQATTIADNGKTYEVKQGDSLWKIARKFPGLTVEKIRLWNDISGTKLKPGMQLTISK